MQELYKAIGRVAPTDALVLIRGESGTGKELVANAIWRYSPRSRRPFSVINCVAIPDTLLESELFGYERGAFTGAQHRRIGRIEQAAGGTIFLDEIGDMPPGIQAKLLRLLLKCRDVTLEDLLRYLRHLGDRLRILLLQLLVESEPRLVVPLPFRVDRRRDSGFDLHEVLLLVLDVVRRQLVRAPEARVRDLRE